MDLITNCLMNNSKTTKTTRNYQKEKRNLQTNYSALKNSLNRCIFLAKSFLASGIGTEKKRKINVTCKISHFKMAKWKKSEK